MASIAELEAYMDKIEARYFALHPDPDIGQRHNWKSIRSYIRSVKDGEIPDTTMETETRRGTDSLLGLRRMMGEEPHPRKAIHKRQELIRAAASVSSPAGAAPP